MNLRIILKKYTVDQEKRISEKMDFIAFLTHESFPTAWELVFFDYHQFWSEIFGFTVFLYILKNTLSCHSLGNLL